MAEINGSDDGKTPYNPGRVEKILNLFKSKKTLQKEQLRRDLEADRLKFKDRKPAVIAPDIILHEQMEIARARAAKFPSAENDQRLTEATRKYREAFDAKYGPKPTPAPIEEPEQPQEFTPTFNREALTDDNVPVFDRVGQVLDACALDDETRKFTDAAKANMAAYLNEWGKYLNNPDWQGLFRHDLRNGDISEMVEHAFRRNAVMPWMTREVSGPRVFGHHQDGPRPIHPMVAVLGPIAEEARSIHERRTIHAPSVELATNFLKGLGVLAEHQTIHDVAFFTNANQFETWQNVDNPKLEEADRKKLQAELATSMRLKMAYDESRGRSHSDYKGPIPTAIPGLTVLVEENRGPNREKEAGVIEIAMDEAVFLKQLQPLAPKIT